MKESLLKLVAVYAAVLFIQCLLFSTPAKAEVARLSIDRVQDFRVTESRPLFSKFYYKKRFYRGNIRMDLARLSAFCQKRARMVNHSKGRSYQTTSKLKGERKKIIRRGTLADRRKQAPWAVALSRNLAKQSAARDSFLETMANWDAKNWIEVEYRREGGRRYLRKIRFRKL